MNEKLKKLTSKNPKDFEPVAKEVINIPDVELFKELVECDDFLFDFVKSNVAKRIQNFCNKGNYINLLDFLKYYSPSYENFIITTLIEFGDNNLNNKILEIFQNGTLDEKIYCAKYFATIKDSRAIDILNKYAFDEDNNLSSNCALALSKLEDKKSYELALKMLDDSDDFKHISGVRFLVSYGNLNSIEKIIETMKKSSFSENIAGEIPYLCDLFNLYKRTPDDCLYTLNLIINALGEILPLVQVFDYNLYDFFEMLIKSRKNSKIATVLLNAIEKFETLTENDEYLFDEDKNTKQEILDIKSLLKEVDLAELYNLVDDELKQDSLFVFTALEFTEDEQKVRNLLSSDNPTLIIKSLEILKQMESLKNEDKDIALTKIVDESIKNIILAI